MIYTVTLNPSLDYMVSVTDLCLGRTNRTELERLVAGGKGINVSIVLKNLGFESIALGYVAGFTGEEISRQVSRMGIQNGFIAVDGMSRINVKITSGAEMTANGKQNSTEETEINGQGPAITPEKVQELMECLDVLVEGDVLFLSGSVPASMPKDIYEQMVKQLEKREICIIVDTTKDLLLKVLPYHPFLIKPNHHELGEIFGVEFHTREEVIPYGRRLQQMGARNVLISLAGEGAVLVAEDNSVYSLPAPKGEVVNSVGAGDSMLAGFMAGWMKSQDYQYAFEMGLAAGSASAFRHQLASKEEIMDIYKQITCEEDVDKH